MRRILASIVAELAYPLGRVIMKADDARMIKRLGAILKITGSLAPESEAHRFLYEMKEVFEMGRPYSDIIRGFVTEARPAQLKAVIRGALSD